MTKEWLNRKNITILPWPPCSPDLNPIENIWGMMTGIVYKDGKQYKCLKDLRSAIERAWNSIGQHKVNILIAKSWTENYEFYQNTTEFMNVMRYLLKEIADILNLEKSRVATSALLYIFQGCFGVCSNVAQVLVNIELNCLFIFKRNQFPVICLLINVCIQNKIWLSKNGNIHSYQKFDYLKNLLNIAFTIIDVVYKHDDLIDQLRDELLMSSKLHVSFPKLLFNAIAYFVNKDVTHFPIKKIFLILQKSIMAITGGFNRLHQLKKKSRKLCGLSDDIEDNNEMICSMRPHVPRQKYTMDSMLDDFIPEETNSNGWMPIMFNMYYGNVERSMNYIRKKQNISYPHVVVPIEVTFNSTQSLYKFWRNKTYRKDLLLFLNVQRRKYLGFEYINNVSTVIGLPSPIKTCAITMKRYLFTPLSVIQEEQHDFAMKYPFVSIKNEVKTKEYDYIKKLYSCLLNDFTLYITSMLKILLTASPTYKNCSINLLSNLSPSTNYDLTNSAQSIMYEIDCSRQKEIIVKCISSIFLLLLQYFKLHHIYEFEFFCEKIVRVNGIPWILNFFNQDIESYITSKNSINCLNFPNCIFEKEKNMKSKIEKNIEYMCLKNTLCWRNTFSIVCLLRVLLKLGKNKSTILKMLVYHKCAAILRNILTVPSVHILMYSLKLIKYQIRYLGRIWRRTGTILVTLIHRYVRHVYADDWAYFIEALPNLVENDSQESANILLNNRTKKELETLKCIDEYNERVYSYCERILMRQKVLTKVNTKLDGETINKFKIGHVIPVSNLKLRLKRNLHICIKNADESLKNNETFIDFTKNTINTESNKIYHQAIVLARQVQNFDCLNPQNSKLCNMDMCHFLNGYKTNSKEFDQILSKHLGDIELSDYFVQNYKTWLDDEIINKKINWDKLFSYPFPSD
ncbi:hypothetical protein A3Q56_05153 [Intoshia linei]|uniref:Tc1-like transposase DDE domain-containing protein n=1 Tax=Intoshia linei TaxID=1819745 RepID=A0A177B0I7_9BILA|nr:hypothetical protein A3Q56_05153 [Intoshia linei]